ncbi:MAG: type II CAAX endopeptidase family protein [Halobacteria archaeon]|nr:type II CAAX endopeptidase family protein [Halobacteria archaeon]
MDEYIGEDVKDKLSKVAASFLVAVGAFLAASTLIFTVASVFRSFGAGSLLRVPSVTFGLSTIVQGAAFGVVAFAYLRMRNLSLSFIKARLPTLRDVALFVGGFILLYVALIVISVVFQSAGVESASNTIQEQGQKNPEIFLVMIPLAFLVIGPGEELLFRGIIQGTLREEFTAAPAVAIASAIFAVGHITALTGGGSKIASIAAIFALSLILGAVYETSENLVVPAMIHASYDAVLFVAMYIRTVGV